VIVVVDSVTQLTPDAARAVAVCGSHGGITAVRFAIETGVAGVILNDAGIGKDGAGVDGLDYAEAVGMPAAVVDYRTARIGDGRDTLGAGVISGLNLWARRAGVEVGQTGSQAARWLASAAEPRLTVVAETARSHKAAPAVVDVAARVVALDSASLIDETMRCWVVVTGSHGGTVGGYAVKYPIRGAIFNDAGVGRDQAGVGRLAVLDDEGIPAATVSHESARIGDGLDTYRSGVISHVNRTAVRAGVRVGHTARSAACALAQVATHLSRQVVER
jgi:hypothetical protein